MINYKFGEILLIPFPFTNQKTSKKRPGVVISSEAYQQIKPDLIIMAITSQSHPTQTFGEFQVKEWEGAGLLKPSYVKPVIATIEQRLIIKQLGKLQTVDHQSLKDILMIILG